MNIAVDIAVFGRWDQSANFESKHNRALIRSFGFGTQFDSCFAARHTFLDTKTVWCLEVEPYPVLSEGIQHRLCLSRRGEFDIRFNQVFEVELSNSIWD